MKHVRASEFRDMDLAGLLEKEKEAELELQGMRFKASFGQTKKGSLIRAKRKEIARMKTVISEKQPKGKGGKR
jgi:ribosomal protein L29